MATEKPRRPVLAIDDQPEIRALIREALGRHGFEVRGSGDPLEALRWLRETEFELAILDFNLPSMDGITLHREIARLAPELARRCVFISGVIQSKENLDYFYRYGGAYLSKPFRLHDLVTAVRQVLDAG